MAKGKDADTKRQRVVLDAKSQPFSTSSADPRDIEKLATIVNGDRQRQIIVAGDPENTMKLCAMPA